MRSAWTPRRRATAKAKPTVLALSTANLFTAVQPGGSLFGLQESNPVDTGVASQGPSSNYGQANDPMVGNEIGGVNVFGGGLGPYALGRGPRRRAGGERRHVLHGSRHRLAHPHALGLDHLAGIGGVSGDTERPDNIIYDIVPNTDGTGQSPAGSGGVGTSHSGFGHPKCLGFAAPSTLPAVQ